MTLLAAFDWDDGNLEKCQRHGVSIAEIEAMFRDGPRVAPDPAHSDKEDRLIAIGRTAEGGPVFVAFTLRTVDGRQLIRPVSALHAPQGG
ncbi:MAG TPA: BrnT family toxin [Devosiaceae bacterium]|nr:BrnT family toxin [Devosiaceae bacterium]